LKEKGIDQMIQEARDSTTPETDAEHLKRWYATLINTDRAATRSHNVYTIDLHDNPSRQAPASFASWREHHERGGYDYDSLLSACW